MKKLHEINAKVSEWNTTPLDDFLGLTPLEMNVLLYHTFGDQSPIRLRKDLDDNTLDQIPLFRIVEEYLRILERDKQIKLTPLGALPKKIMVELYDKRFLLDDNIENGITKLWREEDCIAIRSARLTAEAAGLVKKRMGRLSLTKAAQKLLEENKRTALFHLFFQTFTTRFNWSYNDGYTEEPVGQLGWGFSVLMLHKFGNQPRINEFYASKYLKAFPDFLTFFNADYSTPPQNFSSCYGIRTFKRFLLWFGLAAVDQKGVFLDLQKDTFTETGLLDKVFTITWP